MIYYVNTLDCIGYSSDTKPVDTVPEGMRFWELDTQKVYLFTQGEWKEIKAGTGIWSPSTAEALTNKTIIIDQNIVKTNSGNLGFFAFNNTGQFVFVPIGSANEYMKVNGAGTGFEFGDPNTGTGVWNPTSSETLENKTIDVQKNPIIQTEAIAGSLLLDNGTRFYPLPKGSIGQIVKVKQDGTVGWDTDATGGEGGGGSITGSAFLPSEANRFGGWYNGGTATDNTLAVGELAGKLRVNYSGAIVSRRLEATKGRYIQFGHSNSAHFGGVMSTEPLWMRGTDPYIKAKFRFSAVTDWDLHIGMSSNLTSNYDSEDTANDDHVFMFVRHSTLSHGKYSIIRNDASSNFQERELTNFAPTTNPITVELKCDSANNRFGYRINDEDNIEPTSWTWETTSLPSTSSPLGLVAMADSDTSVAFNFELYLIETTSKLMV